MNRVEIKPRFYCTRPDVKNEGGCPVKDADGGCISMGEDGDALICCYLEVEAEKP